MPTEFPSAVPELPVADMAQALAYYEHQLGFTVDWGRDGGGIAGISQGESRIFLTDAQIRDHFQTRPPIVIWLNMDSNEEVDRLHATWVGRGASILQPPVSRDAYRLHEFVATDPDGNFIRVFHNF